MIMLAILLVTFYDFLLHVSIDRINKVTTDTGEKFLYKCWLYKRVKSTLLYFYPMTGKIIV